MTAMYRLLFLLLILFAHASFGQPLPDGTILLTEDSLGNRIDGKWKFRTGDKPEYAMPGYNDSGWTLVNARYIATDSLNSIVWLRLHIITDSTLQQKPIVIRLSHYGASELYLDGKFLRRFGRIAGKDSVRYYDPQYIPVVATFSNVGEHVLAVRYVNYEAAWNKKVYDKIFTGIQIIIDRSDIAINNEGQNRVAQTFVFTLMFGIFIALGLLHLFLFLYYRSAVFNLSFSLFSLSLALLFLAGLIIRYSTIPSLQLITGQISFYIGIASCITLSAFLNQVFEKKKKIVLVLICLIGLTAIVMKFIDVDSAMFTLVVLIISVAVETMIVVILAIVRKVPGAKIIGIGLLFFTGLILLIAAITIASGGYFEVGDDSDAGFFWFLIMMMAILSIPVSMSAYLAFRFSNVNTKLEQQLKQVQLLSQKTIEQEQEKKKILQDQNEELEKQVAERTSEVISQKQRIEKQHEELKEEKKKSDDLLLNILPSEVAEELKINGISQAKLYNDVSVLFTDFVDFTLVAEKMSPQQLVSELHNCFKVFDEVISRYGIEKIKTIGDAYLAVCGLPNTDSEHALKIVKAAMEIREFMIKRKQELGDNTFNIRIGIHSGPVVAGIVGVKKFAYDIWGDTVNTAARMEQNGAAGKVNISEATYQLIQSLAQPVYVFDYRGEIEAKNKGKLKMYFVNRADI